MKKQANIVSQVLKKVASEVKPGITTLYLDQIAEEEIKRLGATNYNKGYLPKWNKTPFPATLCTSVNSEIGHGIPSDRVLKDGDIISLDVGIKYEGLCGDAALTVPVGTIDNQKQRLLYYARKALDEGIKVLRNDVTVREIAEAIEKYILRRGYVVNHNFAGHTIGKRMHEDPLIPHTTDADVKYLDVHLKTGQVVCLEPMITLNDKWGKLEENGWTISTYDNKPSAFFEHMCLVTEKGCEVLTTHI